MYLYLSSGLSIDPFEMDKQSSFWMALDSSERLLTYLRSTFIALGCDSSAPAPAPTLNNSLSPCRHLGSCSLDSWVTD